MKKRKDKMKIPVSLLILFLIVVLVFAFEFYRPTARIIQANECEWKCKSVGDCSLDNGNGLKLQFLSAGAGKLAIDYTDSVLIDTDESNDNTARISFTSALSNKEYTFYFSHYDSAKAMPLLEDNMGKIIHVKEGEEIKELEYFIADSGDYGRALYLEKIAPYPGNVLLFTDVASGKVFTLQLENGKGLLQIDGQKYFVTKTSEGIIVTWGKYADYGETGDLTMMPKIKLTNGSYIAFVDNDVLQQKFNLDISSDAGVIFIDNNNNILLVPIILRTGTKKLVIGNPVFVSGKCAENIKQVIGTYELICQKNYTTGWHLLNCNTENCRDDEFISCKKLVFILSKEACTANYNITCRENPSCPPGFEVISKKEC